MMNTFGALGDGDIAALAGARPLGASITAVRLC